MNKQQKEKLLQQFLDGELKPSEEKETLHVIADDPELREMLHFDMYLNQAFGQPEAEADSFAVPEDFSADVMKAIAQREEEQARDAVQETTQSGMLDTVKKVIDTILEPRTVQWKPVYGLAAVLVLIAITFTLDLGSFSEQSPERSKGQQAVQTISNEQPVQLASSNQGSNKVWARFFYVNEEAETVSVAGDFSNWEPVELKSKVVNGNKVWTGTIRMEKGEHRYMYIVNGEEWKTDPLATRYQEDGFGNRNAVINL